MMMNEKEYQYKHLGRGILLRTEKQNPRRPDFVTVTVLRPEGILVNTTVNTADIAFEAERLHERGWLVVGGPYPGMSSDFPDRNDPELKAESKRRYDAYMVSVESERATHA